jgi:hypothetical protein
MITDYTEELKVVETASPNSPWNDIPTTTKSKSQDSDFRRLLRQPVKSPGSKQSASQSSKSAEDIARGEIEKKPIDDYWSKRFTDEPKTSQPSPAATSKDNGKKRSWFQRLRDKLEQ